MTCTRGGLLVLLRMNVFFMAARRMTHYDCNETERRVSEPVTSGGNTKPPIEAVRSGRNLLLLQRWAYCAANDSGTLGLRCARTGIAGGNA